MCFYVIDLQPHNQGFHYCRMFKLQFTYFKTLDKIIFKMETDKIKRGKHICYKKIKLHHF